MANIITLSGRLASGPQKTNAGTVSFGLEHSEAWDRKDGLPETSHFGVACLAWGHAANSIIKYAYVGLEIVVHGRLSRFSGVDGLGVLVDSVSYPRVSQLGLWQAEGVPG